MLETVKLTKNFSRHTAVDQLSLSIQPGEIFALLGPNGAGKTTTINMLLGFLEPDDGDIERLRDYGKPIVCIGNELPGITTLGIDNAA